MLSNIASSSIGSSSNTGSVGNKTNVGHGHGQTLPGSTLTNNTLLASSSSAYGNCDKATAQAARSDETFIADEGEGDDEDGDGDGDEDDDEDEDDITVFTLGFGFIYTYIIKKLLRRLRQIVRD